jgi:hypothetical protein
VIVLASLWRRRSLVFWLIAALAAGLLGTSLPQLESLGYEYALLCALFCALASGLMAAGHPARARPDVSTILGRRVPVAALFFQTVGHGLIITAIPLAVSLLNGLRVPFCNLGDGMLFYLLMPVCSVLIACAIGLVVGLATRRARSAVLLYLLFYVLGLSGGLVTFHSSPAVYIFNPFFGYYPGVLYDRLVEVEPQLVTYRVATLVQTVSILAVANLLLDPQTLRLSLKRIDLRSVGGLLAVGALVAAIGMAWAGPSLGHRVSRDDLERHLSKQVRQDRLDLFFSEDTPPELMASLTRDAEFSLFQVERYLQIKSTDRIAVFFLSARPRPMWPSRGETRCTSSSRSRPTRCSGTSWCTRLRPRWAAVRSRSRAGHLACSRTRASSKA